MVGTIVAIAVGAIAGTLLIPASFFFLSCLASLLARATQRPADDKDNPPERPPVAVLIPAHNEEAGLPATLASIEPQLRDGDRVCVVADNCSDRTAEVAADGGAIVFEREHETLRGKGFALQHGLEQLRADPPGIVVFLDADVRAEPGFLDALAAAAADSGKPAQATNLCTPADDAPGQLVAAVAMRFKNLVRPLGLQVLGGPSHLTGTGMALPWAAIEQVSPPGGHLAEDMQWGVELALAGYDPLYVPTARITSPFPGQDAAIASQRTRWEHGHLAMLLTEPPRLLAAAVWQRRWSLWLLGLDLLIPPLALLTLTLLATLAAAGCVAVFNISYVPALLATAGLFCIGAGVSIGLTCHGDDRVNLLSLALMAPQYVFKKLPIYFGFLAKRQEAWVRTARD